MSAEFPLRGALIKEQKKREELSGVLKSCINEELRIQDEINLTGLNIKNFEKMRKSAAESVSSSTIKKGWVALQYSNYLFDISEKIRIENIRKEELENSLHEAKQNTSKIRNNLMLVHAKIENIEKEKENWKIRQAKIKLDREDEELHDLLN